MLLRRPVAALLATVLAAAVLTGCGSSGSADPRDPGRWDAGSHDSDDDEESVDPQDRRLVWDVGSPPPNWTRLSTDAEDIQFAIDDTYCVITFFSRTDINRESVSGLDAVFDEFVDLLGTMMGTHLTHQETAAQLIPTVTDDGDRTQLQFDGVRVSAHPGIEGDLYVYLSGVNSLALSMMCGHGQYEQYLASDFLPFLATKVGVDLTL